MRRRSRERDSWETFDSVEWPESSVDTDDEAFARAIAEGRRDRATAA